MEVVDDEGNTSDGTVTSYDLTQYLADREANYREDGETAGPLMVCCDGVALLSMQNGDAPLPC